MSGKIAHESRSRLEYRVVIGDLLVFFDVNLLCRDLFTLYRRVIYLENSEFYLRICDRFNVDFSTFFSNLSRRRIFRVGVVIGTEVHRNGARRSLIKSSELPPCYQIYRNRVQSSTRNLFSDVDFEGKAQSSRRKLTRVLKFNRKFNPSAVPFNCFYCKVVMILIYISANKIIFYLYIHITSDIIYTTQV